MASSQVEIASSSPFGRVLKDQNSRRDHHRCSRESNARAAAFQKNLTELVRDRLHNCISVSTNENSPNQTKKTVAILTENDHKTTHRNLRFLTKTNENHPDGNDQSSVLNPSQSRILDRWAAKQAREMVSSIEKQSQEAELLGSLSSSSTSSAASKASPDESGNSNVNLGASSLVQIWEARLNINGMNNNNNVNQVVSRTSSGLSNVENVASTSSPRVETSRGSEMGDSVDERPESVHGNPENSFQDWETQSDRTARSSDAGESERDRVRIADIIKRLTSGSDDNEHELGSNVCESPSRERRHALVLEPVEQREQQQPQQRGGLTQLVSSPKIRGRQAFADLLMQMERDRHRELNSLAERQAVSKFSQRGRIQSMLRLKFMQRGMALRDLERPQSAGSPSNRVSIGSSIMQLREKFGTGIENGVTTQISTATSKNSRMEMANTRANQDEASTSNRLCEDNPVQEVLVAQKSSENRGVEEQMGNQVKDPPPRTDDAEQEKISKNTLLDSQETAEATSNVCDVNEMGDDREATNSHQQENSETRAILYERIENEMASEELEASVLDDQNENETAYEEEVTQASDQLFLHPQETAETATFMNNWYENELAEEEGAYDEHQFFDYNNDWITEISRPRSHWESIRQAWYEERLRSSADNDEIRQLIERKRVSTFLSSDFRNTMDRLMASRAMGQADMDEYYNEDEESQERTSQLLLAHLQRHLQPATTSQEEEQTQERDEAVQVDQAVEEEPQGEEYHNQEEEEEEDDDDDDEDDDHYQEEEENEEEDEDEEREEERSSISRPFHEASEYFQSSSTIQMPSPSMITSWSFRDNEVVDDSEPVAPSSPQPFPSQSSLQDSRRSHDSTNRLSIEMELIYDLRGQMEQLHREMAELRKSLQSSVDIQAKMQHSNQQQVHSGKVMAHTPVAVAPTKRSCCICYEMQVDSLLYRCGHMCTCLKCAHELQWSSGKCPICRAPINDVVRAYMDA